jgi:hypothetical protein
LRFEHAASTASTVYRVEAKLANAPGTPPLPWIVGNPIFIGPSLPRVRPQPRQSPATDTHVVFEGGDAARWHVERDAASRGRVAVEEVAWGGEALALEYALGLGTPAGQYAALVAGLERGGVRGWTRVSFKAAADAPMRVSVQLRAPGTGARWMRSVVLETGPQALLVRFTDLLPIDAAPMPIPLGVVDSLLFVVDTTNTPTGRSGTVWLDDVRFEREAEP